MVIEIGDYDVMGETEIGAVMPNTSGSSTRQRMGRVRKKSSMPAACRLGQNLVTF